MSRPAWDAWIEIGIFALKAAIFECRVPHGTRGLKSRRRLCEVQRLVSRPAWDAWIEINMEALRERMTVVASRMGRVD